jgi:hypothetical protein
VRKAVNQKYEAYCCICSGVLLLWPPFVGSDKVCSHDLSLMLVRVEGAHGGEGGALGQHTCHT